MDVLYECWIVLNWLVLHLPLGQHTINRDPRKVEIGSTPPGPQDSVVGNEGFRSCASKKCTPLKTNISS